MFKIQNLFFALLLSQASATSLRQAGNEEGAAVHRDLSQESFLSFEPITVVTDHAALDLDQKMIEELLVEGTNQARLQARDVYMEGAHSKSYAEIVLDEALQEDVMKGTNVYGYADSGKQIRGITMEDYVLGDNILEIQYHATGMQEAYMECQVGGSPKPQTVGCFQNNGTLEIEDFSKIYNYNYDKLQKNFNARTLQLFSTEAEEKMYECGPGCPHETYAKFYSYYGDFKYADTWVMRAFDNGSTNWGKGDADFSKYGDEGTTEAIKKGTAYMNVWMYIIREMEDAVADCIAKCPTCNDDKVHAWDEAVAFYTGSTAKITDGEDGYFPYTLAQKRCADFGTCLSGGNDNDMAHVNSEIFKNFRIGQEALLQGECSEVKGIAKEITQLMTVPLIQGTLRYAYIMDKQNQKEEKAQAEGATFAAAVLPIVNACPGNGPADADIIYDNMRVGNDGNPNYEQVKAAFERNYKSCLGITCDHVGGLIDKANGGFMEGAEPCDHVKHETPIATQSPHTIHLGGTSTTSPKSESSNNDNGPNVGLAVGLTVGIVAGLIIIALLISRKGNQKEFDGVAEPEMA